MAEIEEIGTLLEADTSKPDLDSPEKSDIDVIYEKDNNQTDTTGTASYEVENYDGVEEEFYEDLKVDFETSVERMALDRENEKVVFHNTDDSYDVLEIVAVHFGDLVLKGQIYGQDDTWAMVYDSDKGSLHGKNLSTGSVSELDDSNLINKTELLKKSIIHSEKIMESYLRSGDYNFVKTDKMEEDFERIPEAADKIWDNEKPSGKLVTVKENMETLSDISPDEVFTKEYNSSLKPGLQLAHDDYRFIFHDGSHTEGLDDQTFYGIRALSKNRSEQIKFSTKMKQRDISFKEYAERILREEDILN